MKKLCRVWAIAHVLGLLFSLSDLFFLFRSEENYLTGQALSLWGKLTFFILNFYIYTFLCFILIILSRIKLFSPNSPRTLSRGEQRLLSWFDRFIFSSICIFYLISWKLFLMFNQFLNLEGIKFFLQNPVQIILHVIEVGVSPIIFLISVFLITPCVISPLFRKLISYFNGLKIPENFIGRLCVLSLGAFVVCFSLVLSGKILKDKENLRIFKYKLSPQITLFTSLIPSPIDYDLKEHSDLLAIWHKQIDLDHFVKDLIPEIKKIPIIFIIVESLRSDVLKDNKVMPNLFQLKEQGLFFQNTFSDSSVSDAADPVIVSSHYPLRSPLRHLYPKKIWYPRILFYDLLKKTGFATGFFSAQNLSWMHMRFYLKTPNLDIFLDASSKSKSIQDFLYTPQEDEYFVAWQKRWKTAGKLDDTVVTDRAIRWISKIQRKDFFLWVDFQRSHFPYTWPESYAPKFIPYEINFPVSFLNYPKDKVEVMKNRYWNSLSFIDTQIGKLIAFLKANNLYDESIIVVTGDTGQAFYEHGLVTHGGFLYNEVVLVPTVIKTPFKNIIELPSDKQNSQSLAGEIDVGERLRVRKEKLNKGFHPEFIQHGDIPPTVCGLLGIHDHPFFQGQDLLEFDSLNRKPVFITNQLPFSTQDVIILGQWKFIKDYYQDKEYLYDLKNDFAERVNLVHQRKDIVDILRNQLLSWRKIQIEFYTRKNFYSQYYPPQYLSTEKALDKLSD